MDAVKQFERYRTRLRHFINDGQDLKEPNDQKMIWAYMCEHAAQDVAAFQVDAPITSLADEFVKILGPPASEWRASLFGLYRSKSESDLWLDLAPIHDRKYWQAHVVRISKKALQLGEAASFSLKSGVFLDYGNASESSVMILRDLELGTLSYSMLQWQNELLNVIERDFMARFAVQLPVESKFARTENEHVQKIIDRIKW